MESQCMQLYIDTCVPQDERCAYNFMCYPFFYYQYPATWQPHPIFGGWMTSEQQSGWMTSEQQSGWMTSEQQPINKLLPCLILIDQSVSTEWAQTLRVGWVSSTWTINQTHLMFWWLHNHRTPNLPKKKLKDAGKQSLEFTIICAAVAKCSIVHNSTTAVHSTRLHCCRFLLCDEVNVLVSKLLRLQA